MIKVEVSTKAVVALVGLVLGFGVLVRLWPVVLITIVSLMFAAALMPFVEFQVRHRMPRGLAVLTVVLTALLTVAVIGLIVVPVVIDQGRAIADRLPELRADTADFLDRHGAGDLARQVREYRPGRRLDPGQVADAGRTVLDALTTTVTVVALTAYILFDARRLQRFVFFSTPARYHTHIETLQAALQRVVGGYVRGQLLTSACITVFTAVVLTVLRVPNPLALAVLAGIADMVPMVGIIFCVGPATLSALDVSVPIAVVVAALLLMYQEFENRVLVQKIYGTTLQLPAVVVLLALLIGAELLGLVGALLSLPAVAAVRVLIEYGYDVRRRKAGNVAPADEIFAPDVGVRATSALREH